ncbi:MAG: hypothetical protein ACLPXZ_12185 [Mycobacterium sp.]
MDEWDWDRDDVVDLDGCEATGDPQLDVFGYNSPRRRGENLTGFTSTDGSRERARDEAAAAKRRAEREQRRREAVAGNVAAARQRVVNKGEGRETTPAPVRPVPVTPDLPPHVSAAIAQGMPNRDLGMWRVDVDGYGRAVWQRVEAAAPGHPQITVEQTAAPQWQPVAGHLVQPQPARRRWWQRRRPAEPQPSPGTQIW